MADWLDWTGEPGPWESNAAPAMDWGSFTQGGPGSWAGQVTTDFANGPNDTGGGGSSWLTNLLSGGGQALGSLFGKGGAGGPLLSALGSLGGGAIGSNAANEAAQLQAAALNRGLDLSTSQWLQQLERTAPWVQAGQQALGTLQGLSGQQLPGLPGATPAISGAQYGLPGTTPGWNPQMYQGPAGVDPNAYRWTPGQGPRAADYRYTPGQTPDAAQYQYRPGAVPTLSGQELLANDPGVAFRLAEGRKALEGSAAARGGLLSGPTLAALQRQGQELSAQEYSNAFARAAQQAQMREQWGQQASAQNFGQAMSAAQLREQINQVASQQGWSQSQAESAFREAMAQQASQQGFQQSLGAQGQAFTQGLQGQQWNTLQQQQYAQEQYRNMLEQSKLRYGMDVTQNATDYERQQALYKQQLAQSLLPWEQQSTLAQLGAQVTGQLGNQGIASSSGISNLLSQLGSAQGTGAAGQGLAWTRALGGAANQLPSLLAGLNA